MWDFIWGLNEVRNAAIHISVENKIQVEETTVSDDLNLDRSWYVVKIEVSVAIKDVGDVFREIAREKVMSRTDFFSEWNENGLESDQYNDVISIHLKRITSPALLRIMGGH